MLKRLKPDFTHRDGRGSLVQLVRAGYTQFNVITSRAGAERGRHFHKRNGEAFYIISGKVRVDVSSHGQRESYQFGDGDFFSIEPLDLHSFSFIEDTVLASMYDLGVELEDGKKDIYDEAEYKAYTK